MITTIAIPSERPGGIEAKLGDHFGHCDLYTILSVENGEIVDMKVIPNESHQQGGCMAPVQHLARNGVKVLIAGGMGLRPLIGFKQVGIEVYHGGSAENVGEAVSALLTGNLTVFKQQHACSGGEGCH